MLLQLAHYSGLRLSVTQVSTACGSGRVLCGKQTRPLPQAVLTRNAMSTGYMQSQTAIWFSVLTFQFSVTSEGFLLKTEKSKLKTIQGVNAGRTTSLLWGISFG